MPKTRGTDGTFRNLYLGSPRLDRNTKRCKKCRNLLRDCSCADDEVARMIEDAETMESFLNSTGFGVDNTEEPDIDDLLGGYQVL